MLKFRYEVTLIYLAGKASFFNFLYVNSALPLSYILNYLADSCVSLPTCRWVDNIRMDLQKVGCGYMDWIGLAQDIAVMNLRVV